MTWSHMQVGRVHAGQPLLCTPDKSCDEQLGLELQLDWACTHACYDNANSAAGQTNNSTKTGNGTVRLLNT